MTAADADDDDDLVIEWPVAVEDEAIERVAAV